jgi:hypothetical protein
MATYDVLVEDLSDKNGYATLSDERAAIRECKWLQWVGDRALGQLSTSG